jgi:hypothetical protein
VKRQDQFQVASGEVTMNVVRPRLFCNPVNKNGEGIISPSTHLTCYATSLFTTFDRKRKKIAPTDQFGVLALDLRSRPSTFCVPSLDITESQEPSAGASSSALVALPATDIDEYNLYRAKRTPRTPRFKRRKVNLVDQWIDDDVELTRPARFGTPAKIKGSSYINEEAKLTCYQIRKAEKFKRRDVEILNEFGRERLTVRKPHMLCVPSEEVGIEDEN